MYIASVFAQLERGDHRPAGPGQHVPAGPDGAVAGGTTPTGFRAERTAEVIVDGRARTACRLVPDPAGGAAPRPSSGCFWPGRASAACPAPWREGGHHRPHRAALLPARPAGDSAKPGVLRRGPRRLGLLRRPGGGSLLSPGGLRRPPGPAGLPEAGLHRRALPATRWTSGSSPWGGTPPWCPARRGGPFRSCSPRTGPPAVHNRRALLSGLLFCARCGEKLLPKARKGGSYDYICRAKLRRGAAACSCPNLSGAAADQAALDALSAQFPRLAPGWRSWPGRNSAPRAASSSSGPTGTGAALAFTLCRL